jgi:hypothetical protein
MLTYIQESFIQGMNQQLDSTRIDKSEYALLINGRNRYDFIRPINLPLRITDPLINNGNMQGSYDVGSVNIVFKNGKAFYKDENFPSSNYNQVAEFQMDPNAPLLFAETVPTSYNNFSRVPVENDTRRSDVRLVTPISGSAAGLVVQDGINPPWIINSDLTARQLKGYSEWDAEKDREYVPIGKMMLYSNGILYIVSREGTSIYHSVTGRPLDFMVNIDNNGDKLPNEANGGAATMAFSVSFEPITCIARLPTDDGTFFVSTGSKASYTITPLVEVSDLILGEPDYKITFLFSDGSISPFGFIELIGDSAFVSFTGLRSFNSVLQLKNEGKNSPFSKKIGPILQGIVQDYTAAINFDNFAFFAVNTIYGRGIVVYDTLNQVFVGLDIYPGVEQIIKFTVVKTILGTKLFFVDSMSNYYEAFASEEIATCSIYFGDWCSDDPSMESKPWQLKLVYNDCVESGTVSASVYADKKLGGSLSQQLVQSLATPNEGLITPPFGVATTDTVQILDFDFTVKGLQSWRAGFYVSWAIDAKLSHVKFSALDEPNISSPTTQANRFATNKTYLDSLVRNGH